MHACVHTRVDAKPTVLAPVRSRWFALRQASEAPRIGNAEKEIAAAVQRQERIAFESAAAEAYHARKHQREIPVAQVGSTGHVVTDYAAAAMDTVRTGEVGSVMRLPDGSVRVEIGKRALVGSDEVDIRAVV